MANTIKEISIVDIKSLIASLVSNAKIELINSLNSNGFPTSQTISDFDLMTIVYNIFLNNNEDGWKVVRGMDITNSSFTQEQIISLIKNYSNVTDSEISNAISSNTNLSNNVINQGKNTGLNANVYDLTSFVKGYWRSIVGGETKIVGQSSNVVTQQPALSPTTVIWLAVFGIVAIIGILYFTLRKPGSHSDFLKNNWKWIAGAVAVILAIIYFWKRSQANCITIPAGYVNAGQKVCCPSGMHKIGDGSACQKSTETPCALYGNNTLARCY